MNNILDSDFIPKTNEESFEELGLKLVKKDRFISWGGNFNNVVETWEFIKDFKNFKIQLSIEKLSKEDGQVLSNLIYGRIDGLPLAKEWSIKTGGFSLFNKNKIFSRRYKFQNLSEQEINETEYSQILKRNDLPNFEVSAKENHLIFKVVYGGFKNEYYKDILEVLDLVLGKH